MPTYLRDDTEVAKLARSFHAGPELPNLLDAVRAYAVTPRLRTVLQYVVGSTLYQLLRPEDPLPVLDVTGQSGAGKTFFSWAAVNAVWGRRDTGLGGDVLESSYRLGAVRSMTNLPLVIDEAARWGNDNSRAAGIRRGTSSQGMRHYKAIAPLILARNTAYDDASSAAAWGGNERRRIPVTMESGDRVAIAASAWQFRKERLWCAPCRPAILDLLRGRTREELLEIVTGVEDERGAVLQLGAHLLGQSAEAVVGASERPETHFLDWLQATAQKALMVRQVGTYADPVPVFPDLGAKIRVEGETAWVTQPLIDLYSQESLRSGRAPLYRSLTDLRQLAGILQVSPDQIYTRDSEHNRWFSASRVVSRVARIPLGKCPEQRVLTPLPGHEMEAGKVASTPVSGR